MEVKSQKGRLLFLTKVENRKGGTQFGKSLHEVASKYTYTFISVAFQI